jgi:hypothetical protein
MRWLQTLGLLAFVAILLAACGTSPKSSPSRANTAPPATAQAYAQQALAQATLPFGARLSNWIASSLLEHPFATIDGDGTDLRKLYLVSELPPTIKTYIESELPAGAKLTNVVTIGSPTHSADAVMIALATPVPHDYSAVLVYEIAAISASRSEIRVDADVVLGPRRSS